MANTTPSPNMNLPVPSVGVDPGPDWANNINGCLSIVDGHNHAPGSGVQINPSGININADLSYNSNNITNLRSSRFAVQNTPLSGGTDIGCLYVSGVDLYYNDTSANQIQITSGGAVNATSSGISSGTATAAFSGGVLVVNSASLTPANIQAASILMGNNVASSNYLTLAPPSSMAANFGLTLPSIPGATSFMTLDTSGNMAATIHTSQGITQGMLAARQIGSTVGAGGVALSSSCGSFTTASGSPVAVTNLSVTITTTGRPVEIMLQSDGSGNYSYIGAYWQNASAYNGVAQAVFTLNNGATDVADYLIGCENYVPEDIAIASYNFQPASAFRFVDTTVAGTPGTYTYTISTYVITPNTTSYCQYANLIAYEI